MTVTKHRDKFIAVVRIFRTIEYYTELFKYLDSILTLPNSIERLQAAMAGWE